MTARRFLPGITDNIQKKDEAYTTIMLYKNMKAMVHSPDGNTDFNVVARILQRNTLVPR